MNRVYLTGAGPGDIELLTVKALRIIREADVIIYDRLANPDILEEAKNGCEFVYVGKEDGRHIMPQDEINYVIYQNALTHEPVARLKVVIHLFLAVVVKKPFIYLSVMLSLK